MREKDCQCAHVCGETAYHHFQHCCSLQQAVDEQRVDCSVLRWLLLTHLTGHLKHPLKLGGLHTHTFHTYMYMYSTPLLHVHVHTETVHPHHREEVRQHEDSPDGVEQQERVQGLAQPVGEQVNEGQHT